MRVLIRFTLGLIVVSALLASGTETVELEPIHEDSAAMERAALEVARAFLRDDGETAGKWLHTMEKNSRRLHPERDEAYGSKIVNYDQSFHLTIDRAREVIAISDVDRAFDQYKWTQKSCIDCHRQARQQGLLAEPDQTLQSAG
jgi:hypothetical protein